MKTTSQAVAVLAAVMATGAGVGAQIVGSGTLTRPLLATSSDTGSNQVAPGPLPPGGVTLRSPGQSVNRAVVHVQPIGGAVTLPPGAVGFGVGITLDVFSAWSAPGSGAASGQALFTFQAPQAVRGVLVFVPTFQDWPSVSSLVGDIGVDTDGNAVPDAFARTSGAPLEIPLAVGPAGHSVLVDWNVTATMLSPFPNGLSGAATLTWDVVFVPGTYAIETYGAGCARLGIQRSVWSTPALAPTLACSTYPGPDFVLPFFAFGTSEQNVTLPQPPQCPLLVGSPSLALPTSTLGQDTMYLTLPLLALPPGLQFRCQAIWLDTAGNVITSDAVRTR